MRIAAMVVAVFAGYMASSVQAGEPAREAWPATASALRCLLAFEVRAPGAESVSIGAPAR